VGRRKHHATHAEQAKAEWELAQDWVHWLSAGNQPVPLTMHGLILEQGEVAYVTTPMHYSRLYGGSGEYMRSGGFAFGKPGFVLGMMAANAAVNAARRSAARKDMQPLWRDLQELPTVVTNYRIMCHMPPRGWLSFYYTAVQEFYPEPSSWMVTYGFSNAEPLRLGGLAAPTVAVLTAWCLLGAERWRENPGLAPLTQAAQVRQLQAGGGRAELEGGGRAELEGGVRRMPRIPGEG
jgi:hypothetical protein